MTIQEKLMYEGIRKLYKKIQTPDTIFTKEWMKDTMKKTISKLYELFPSKNFGALTVNWFDVNEKKPVDFGECVYYFQICFHDKYTKVPWLICRFYKKDPIVKMYVYER